MPPPLFPPDLMQALQAFAAEKRTGPVVLHFEAGEIKAADIMRKWRSGERRQATGPAP
jgi:hypothetical protein